MSDLHADRSPKDPPAAAMTAGKPGARKKIRPTYSCLSCHKRKVKCDRVKPCGACCLRGTPSECQYGTSKGDRHYIHQSALIENLLHTCDDLRRQLAEARQLAHLPPIKDEEAVPSSSSLYQIKHNDADKDDAERRELELPDALIEPGREVEEASLQPKESSPPSVPLVQQKKALADPALAGALIELFVERLVSSFSPEDHAKYGGTIALREASEMRISSPILCNAFEAASLTFAGRRDRNRSIEVAGHSRYLNVLRHLQRALYDPKESKSTEVLVVVLLSTIVEAFKQTSKDSIFRHQLGGLEILRSRTPFRHRNGIERSLFVDLRLYWVTAALIHRKPTFMASKEWLTVPWPGDAPSKDILHRLLDIAVEVPGYLAQLDEFSALLQAGNTPSVDLASLQTRVWEQAKEIQNRLHFWKTMYADTYPPGSPREEYDAPSPDGFPMFECRHPHMRQSMPAKILIYPDILLATSMCFYWALSLVVSASNDGLISLLTMHERYQFACNICRSMKYYIQNIPGCLVSRIMFALRTAFDAFSNDMVEKQYMTNLFQFVGQKFEFPVFSNKCTSSSIRGEEEEEGT